MKSKIAALVVLSSGGKPANVAKSLQSVQPGSSAPATSSPPASAATPDSKAKYSQSCDYLLGDNFEDPPYEFIALADVHNTGDVDMKAKVVAYFIRVGYPDYTTTRTVKIPWKHSKQVTLTSPATSDQIDEIQAYNGIHNCHIKATIEGTFEAAHRWT